MEGEERKSWRSETPRSSFSQERKRVLARLKKPGRPLKTIRLMKYVKAHKETLRPFREEGVGGGRGVGGNGTGSWANTLHQQK